MTTHLLCWSLVFWDMDVSENSENTRVPQNGWFIMETLLKWIIWGYHYFRKHPYEGAGSVQTAARKWKQS